jgi:hypothetical protein
VTHVDRPQTRRDEYLDPLADQLRPLVTGQTLRLPVGKDDLTPVIDDDGCVRNPFQEIVQSWHVVIVVLIAD